MKHLIAATDTPGVETIITKTTPTTPTTPTHYLMMDCNYSSVQARALLASKVAPLIKLACKTQNRELVATLANRVFIPA